MIMMNNGAHFIPDIRCAIKEQIADLPHFKEHQMIPEALTAQQEEVLAQALNAPLYKSTWHIPAYREGDAGDWRIAMCPFHLEHGYVTGLWAVSSMPLLM